MPVLQETTPPKAMNWAKVVTGAGTLARHCTLVAGGQLTSSVPDWLKTTAERLGLSVAS